MNSRAKGARGERELLPKLARVWPECKRNLDQYALDKRDVLETPGYHWQVKRVEKLNIWAAFKQAVTEARNGDTPVVVFRRNRGEWLVTCRLDDYLDLIARAND